MTSNSDERRDLEGGISDEQRAAAFADPSELVRAAALRAGRTPVPPKFILWATVAFFILGFGGVAVEHYFGNLGAGVAPASGVTHPPTPTSSVGRGLNSPIDQFLSLKRINGSPASPFVLRDQANQLWSTRDGRGKVIVLTFFNSNCNDICPVLGAEIKQAIPQLGAARSHVDFVIVNTDPRHIVYSAQPRALTVPHLSGTASVVFLTGSLKQLNTIWTKYGVTITVGVNANQQVHNNILYFID